MNRKFQNLDVVLLFGRRNGLFCLEIEKRNALFLYFPLFKYFSVLGKVAHCIVKLENFLNMVSFEIFSAAAEIETASCIEFGLPFMVVPIHIVDQKQLLILFIKSRYKMFHECLEGEGDCSGEILKKKA
ncbi:hypothetical protein T01_13932 [Trichinella spiralis]|uniref:Uncharacterized protein n=1 Tax=Trichinella spiralis TaxID=6334 RepID=A0A0V1B8C1_TRISP|nr:hypothetical protein T01_13932 [Trichinella spiralis]